MAPRLGHDRAFGDQETKEIIRQELLENEGTEFGGHITNFHGDLPPIPNSEERAIHENREFAHITA